MFRPFWVRIPLLFTTFWGDQPAGIGLYKLPRILPSHKKKHLTGTAPTWMSRTGSERINGDRINGLGSPISHIYKYRCYNPDIPHL